MSEGVMAPQGKRRFSVIQRLGEELKGEQQLAAPVGIRYSTSCSNAMRSKALNPYLSNCINSV